jgi:hypothetical protein
MLNLKGQSDTASGRIHPKHQEMLQQAFSTVLADQLMEGSVEEQQATFRAAAAAERAKILEEEENRGFNADSEDSSDIDFDDMDAELDRIQLARRTEVCFSPLFPSQCTLPRFILVLRVSPHCRFIQ